MSEASGDIGGVRPDDQTVGNAPTPPARPAGAKAGFVDQSDPAGSTPRKRYRLATATGRVFLGLGRLTSIVPIRMLRHRIVTQRGGTYFKVTRANGIQLDALYIPPLGMQGDRPTIVISHGYLESKELHLREAMLFSEHGHGVVLFDHRSHGRSTGRAITFGVLERQDVRAVIDAAAERGWVKDSVVTYGYSLGGGTVLQHATLDPRVIGVVAMAPFADLTEAVRSFRELYVPFVPESWVLSGFEEASKQVGFDMFAASAMEAVAELDIPILLVVGDADRHLPAVRHACTLAERGSDRQTRLITVTGAGHLNLTLKRWPGIDEALVTFLKELSPDEAPPNSPRDTGP